MILFQIQAPLVTVKRMDLYDEKNREVNQLSACKYQGLRERVE
jgi:hypothetical protein